MRKINCYSHKNAKNTKHPANLLPKAANSAILCLPVHL